MSAFTRDLRAILERDPAARNAAEVVLCYPSIWATTLHRLAHACWKHRLRLLARMISQSVRFWTGIEIHPGATLGYGIFIDHGHGVVIGETAVVGDNTTLYQGVTLGGTGKDAGKRHPTLEENVVVGTGAKVLGPFTVGKNARIGAGAVVLKEVPPDSTVVGNPGRVVRLGGQRVDPLDQIHMPDPVKERLDALLERTNQLEACLRQYAGGTGCERCTREGSPDCPKTREESAEDENL